MLPFREIFLKMWFKRKTRQSERWISSSSCVALICLCGKKPKFKTSGAEKTKRTLIRKRVVYWAEGRGRPARPTSRGEGWLLPLTHSRQILYQLSHKGRPPLTPLPPNKLSSGGEGNASITRKAQEAYPWNKNSIFLPTFRKWNNGKPDSNVFQSYQLTTVFIKHTTILAHLNCPYIPDNWDHRWLLKIFSPYLSKSKCSN